MKLTGIFVLLYLLLNLSGCRESLIAFSSSRDGNYEICTVKLNGENYCNITCSEGDDFAPAWSPDGRKIVFYSARDTNKLDPNDHNTEIYIMNSDGTKQQRLTDNTYTDMEPKFSPDSNRIAFYGDPDEKYIYDLFIMKYDGTDLMNLTRSSNAVEVSPSWIDSSTLLFSRTYIKDTGRRCNIFTLKINNSELKHITDTSYNDHNPVYSPASKMIAFIRENDAGIPKLYVMNVDGSNITGLTTDNNYPDSIPTWSPDGKQIAFASERSKSIRIYITNIDGSNEHELMLPSPLNDIWPAWSPF